MARQSKPKTDVTEPTSTPVVENSSTLVEKTTKSAKQPKEPKAKATKQSASSSSSDSSTSVSEPVSTSVTTQVAQSQPATSQSTENSTESFNETDVNDLVAQTTEFFGKLNQAGALFATLKSEFKALEKKWSREIKTAQKSQAKRKRKSGNRQPSGFVKPTKISDELAKFLEKPAGTEMARTDVTREINTYIRAHKLQDKENGRKINPDAKLAALLKLKKTDELTYFNLQRYMSPHFSKSEKTASA